MFPTVVESNVVIGKTSAGVPVIAGGGDLPIKVAEACRANNRLGHTVALKSFASPDDFPDSSVRAVAELGGVIEDLKSARCDAICFAGIVTRPDFSALKPDMKGISVLPKLVAAAAKGDDALLRAVVSVFEKEGFEVVGVQDVAQDLIGGLGPVGKLKSQNTHQDDIRKAMDIAGRIGDLDIGQGAVVCQGLVLAVEAQEGTDNMLDRVTSLPLDIRGHPDKKSGVLAKRPKPGQELRVDLPAIGVSTVEKAASGGLAGIVYPEGRALILGQSAVSERADALGLFVEGLPRDNDDG